MKRISLVILLISAMLVGSAQQPIPSFSRKKNKGAKTEQTEQSSQTTTETPSTEGAPASSDGREVPALTRAATTPVAAGSVENELLSKAIDNAFLVIKSSYNVRDRETGGNVSGNDFFGTVYSVAPLLPYGFGVDNRFLKPWKSDPKYNANQYGEDLVSVDKIQCKMAKDSIYEAYRLNKTVGDTLAPGFVHIMDSTFHNQGLRIEIGNGAKSGYMVWFYVNPENGQTRYTIIPTHITFNENSIFNVRQPSDMENVIGGAFLNMNADEPGCLRLNLMAIARIDPYSGSKWELVKMQSVPTPPVKAKAAEPVKETKKEEAKSAPETQDDSIIPAQSGSKDKDKGKKSAKGSSKSGDKEGAKSSKKSDKGSGSSTSGKSGDSSKK